MSGQFTLAWRAEITFLCPSLSDGLALSDHLDNPVDSMTNSTAPIVSRAALDGSFDCAEQTFYSFGH